MVDRVIVFNRFGRALDELDGVVQRQWKLERTIDVGKGQLSMALNSDKCSPRLLQENNIVYVESDQDGIPPWAGVIWPRFHSDGSTVNITLRSCEWLFGQRFTDGKQKPEAGNPSTVALAFLTLIHRASYIHPMPATILDPVFDMEDAPGSWEWNAANCFEAMNDLATQSLNYWWLQPIRNLSTGVLEFEPHMQTKAGRIYQKRIEMNDNFLGVAITREGDPANCITGYGRFADWSEPTMWTEIDPVAAFKYGLIEDTVTYLDIDTEAGLKQPVHSELRHRAWPHLSVTGKIIGAPFPLAGMRIFPKVTPGYEFMTGGRVVVPMTITACAYDPITESMSINAAEFPE